jgi:hypothetical protein
MSFRKTLVNLSLKMFPIQVLEFSSGRPFRAFTAIETKCSHSEAFFYLIEKVVLCQL